MKRKKINNASSLMLAFSVIPRIWRPFECRDNLKILFHKKNQMEEAISIHEKYEKGWWKGTSLDLFIHGEFVHANQEGK